jgi:single-stranded-DNA-specific exonuclease
MKWVKDDLDADLVREMAHRYDIDLLTASILARRKIVNPDQVLYFLEDDLDYLHNPFLFESMEDVVDRILLAADEKEKVLVFGDSDTDGVTATALMLEALASVGIEASFKVPQGEEPYGISMNAIDTFATEGGSLLITVDCGISNHAEIAHAAELGIDVIICDHHKLQGEIPSEAVAVIDPKIEGCGYPFRELSGAGVAYKAGWAMRFGRTGLYKQSLALLDIRLIDKDDSSSSQVKTIPTRRFSIEAMRLHNLVETGRFSEILDEGSPKTGDVLIRLARFLEGRSIFVWQKTVQSSLLHDVFGPSVDIESYDITQDAAVLFPKEAGANATALSKSPQATKYSSREIREIDVLKSIFTRIAMRKAGLDSEGEDSLLQLAMLGTIADMMPLKGENRIIVRRGVKSLNATPRQGIKELVQKVCEGRSLSATDIAWQITPLLNAAGRIGKPEIALELLLSPTPAARESAVENIQLANTERKKIGAEVWDAVYPIAHQNFEENAEKFILVGSPVIKAGITGLLASRMVSTFKVPAIVAAFKADGTIVGSVRTTNGLDISGMLAASADLFLDFGGHDAAAGFSLVNENWNAFVTSTVNYLHSAKMVVAEDKIRVDAELPHKYLKPEIQKLYARFEPFGEENPPLVFLSRKVSMVDAQIVGRAAKSHLKLTLDFGQYKWPALLWDGAERLERDFSFKAKEKIDVLFKVTLNRWNGEEKPQLELYDVRRESPD